MNFWRMKSLALGFLFILLLNQIVESDAGMREAIKEKWAALTSKSKSKQVPEKPVAIEIEEAPLPPGIPGVFWAVSKTFTDKSDPDFINFQLSKLKISLDIEKSACPHKLSAQGSFNLKLPKTWRILSPIIRLQDAGSPFAGMVLVADKSDAKRLVVLQPNKAIQHVELPDPLHAEKGLEPISFGCDHHGLKDGTNCGGLTRSLMDNKFYAFSYASGSVTISPLSIDIPDWNHLKFFTNAAWDRKKKILIVPITNNWLVPTSTDSPGHYLRVFFSGNSKKRSKSRIFKTLVERVKPGYSSESWLKPKMFSGVISPAQADQVWPKARHSWEYIGRTLDGTYYAVRPGEENHWIFVGDIWIGSIKEVPEGLRGPKVVVTKCENVPTDLDKEYQVSVMTRARIFGESLTRRRALIRAENGKLFAISVAGSASPYLVIREIDLHKGPSTKCFFSKWDFSGEEQPNFFIGDTF